ncbi:MAG: hypothetical protein ABI855_06225 [Bacteroidota bacterium]
MNLKKITIELTIILTGLSGTISAQTFTLKEKAMFVPQKKEIILLADTQGRKMILFHTSLQVNTDGVPVSYHPFDLKGDSIALNSILNAVAIYRKADSVRISNPPKKYNKERNAMAKEAYTVYAKWRDSDYEIMPPGYSISWKSVLIPVKKNNIEKPCILSGGEYKGYYVSGTSLTNGLTADKGECDCNNFVNPFEVPNLVLAGGSNPVSKYGAAIGDLLVAYNPATQKTVYAVIGDKGPPENLGEASVILNMKLTGIADFPKTKKDSYKLATKNDIIITIIPKSKGFEIEKPYTSENIAKRAGDWIKSAGFATESEFIEFILKFKNGVQE